jgi:hypothetical protein
VLAAGAARRAEIATARRIDLREESAEVRRGLARSAAARARWDRRVEITGPTGPQTAINALDCGANVWLADLEDANTPHWRNVVGGQVVLRDAVRRTLAFTAPDGREYRRRQDGRLPTIVPRPRGWHLPERHLLVDGEPTVGALVDAGLHPATRAGTCVPPAGDPVHRHLRLRPGRAPRGRRAARRPPRPDRGPRPGRARHGPRAGHGRAARPGLRGEAGGPERADLDKLAGRWPGDS